MKTIYVPYDLSLPEDREYEIDRFSEREELLREKALYDSEIRRNK